MNTRTAAGNLLLISLAALATAAPGRVAPARAETLRVLTGYAALAEPEEMMKAYLLRQVAEAASRWREEYEARKTPEQIADYQKRLKEEFARRIGGFPERAPLHARTVGVLQRKGYRVEKILFESQPKHYVSASLYLPDAERFRPPFPAVAVPCGHSDDGKAYAGYATYCALAASNGLAAMIFDPIDQGERHQWIDADGKASLACCPGHNMVGVGSILLGRNTARFEIYDGMRVIDYLQSRDDVATERIGCSGNSGGGTQTAYLMALDERIVAAAPSCYICGLFGRLLEHNGAQDAEQNIFGQLALGMDHADYCMMRAPRPTLLCTATNDYFNIEDAWNSFRAAKRLYSRLGYGERMCLVETDQPHGFSLRLREASVRWMCRWLDGRDQAIFEPEDLDVPAKEDLQCTPGGEVMLLPGARSVYDLNRDCGRELAETRKRLWSETPPPQMLRRVAEMAGVRRPGDLPQPRVENLGTVERPDCRIERIVIRPEDGIFLPALLFLPKDRAVTAGVVYVHEDGKAADAAPGGAIDALVRAGKAVLAVDLRGTGETQRLGQKYFNPGLHGPDGQDYYIAYHLGRSYVGMRVEDLLVCARWLAKKPGGDGGVELVSVGYLGSSALHAAALEPELFASVKLVRPLVSWANVVELGYSKNRLVDTVHGALCVYDLPDLARVVGEKLTIEDPRDAMGEPCARP
ncbi:MAG: acetylxylan esterase [Pirellulales bacterium]|nr:acetylxylan esterase [Pirellulales bacterium]